MVIKSSILRLKEYITTFSVHKREKINNIDIFWKIVLFINKTKIDNTTIDIKSTIDDLKTNFLLIIKLIVAETILASTPAKTI